MDFPHGDKVKNKSKLTMAFAMTIFGTIGIFRRYIPLSSGAVSLVRGLIGTIVLLLFVYFTKKQLSWKNIRANLWKLIISGALIGFNWICLFEAYNYTTVSVATLCYYMAPVFVLIVSPVVLKTKMTVKEVFVIVVALLGMALVSGAVTLKGFEPVNVTGVLYGTAAAVMYAAVVLINKKITGISAYEKTITQLGTAAVVLVPYVFLTEKITKEVFTLNVIVLLLVVGIVHTGIAYALYFASMDGMSASAVALYSYIDPVVAILLSALFLKEPMSIAQIIGAVLILSATVSLEFKKN